MSNSTQSVANCGLSQFATLIAKWSFGFPPLRYLIELRLNNAIKLLRHTDHTIGQIAAECGFPNRYYFTRMFSKYRRTSTSAFRAGNRARSS